MEGLFSLRKLSVAKSGNDDKPLQNLGVKTMEHHTFFDNGYVVQAIKIEKIHNFCGLLADRYQG